MRSLGLDSISDAKPTMLVEIRINDTSTSFQNYNIKNSLNVLTTNSRDNLTSLQ